jgi:nucleoside-diphosphate-sugar epimerase
LFKKNSIFLIGSSGFVGTSFLNYFKNEVIRGSSRGKECDIQDSNIVIHLAGKAHDLKRTSKPEEYYQVNTELTKRVFDAFIASNAKVLITLSSVKAVADEVEGELTESQNPNPVTHYGKSKLYAENYILSKEIPEGKQVYILRPCMIHGPGNKGNLNLLYKLTSIGIPWPLGAFQNKRSFCSIDNLMFIIKELIQRDDIPSGVYNVADDEPIGTNMIISLIAKSKNRSAKIWNISKKIIILFAKFGDLTKLPLNSERLEKLTQNYVVSNQKILNAIGKELPMKASDGMLKTLNSFNS